MAKTVMLGFTLAAFNLDRIRSYRSKHPIDQLGRPTGKPKQSRPKRRVGTWSELIETRHPRPI